LALGHPVGGSQIPVYVPGSDTTLVFVFERDNVSPETGAAGSHLNTDPVGHEPLKTALLPLQISKLPAVINGEVKRGLTLISNGTEVLVQLFTIALTV
jgi:hypothetical protein